MRYPAPDRTSPVFRGTADVALADSSGQDTGRTRTAAVALCRRVPRRSATVSREAPERSRTSAPGVEARCSSAELRRRWCGRRESNPWAEARRLLRPVRLPVPPRPHGFAARAPHLESSAGRLRRSPAEPARRQSVPRAKSEISCGVAVSKPTTSEHPGIGRIGDREAVRDHGDHGQPRVDARRPAVVLQSLRRRAAVAGRSGAG